MTKAVLLVEDVAVTAMAIADVLEDGGYRTIGPFASSSEAVNSLATERPDYAILDVSIRGGTSVEVARELQRLNVPFVLHTGWTPSGDGPDEFRGAPWLEKPVTYERLLDALAGLERTRQRSLVPAQMPGRRPAVDAPAQCPSAR